MTEKIRLTDTNEAELAAEPGQLSRNRPGKAVTACVTFGTGTAYVYSSVSRVPVDGPDTRQMLATYGGVAFVDGQIKQPTPAWERRRQRVEKQDYQP